MTEVALGFSRGKTTVPAHRGERIAAWLRARIKAEKVSAAEIAFRIQQDRRDVQRLLDTNSCGHRLEDALAAHFGWPFVRAVMAAVIDNALEAEIARERAEIAAQIKEVYAEASGNGFDKTAIRQVVRLRKIDRAKRQEAEAILDLYLSAVGEI